MIETLICGLIEDDAWQQIKQVFELDAINFDGYTEYAKFKPNPLLQALLTSDPLDIRWIYYWDKEYQQVRDRLDCIFSSWEYICSDPEDDEYSFGVWDSIYVYDAKHFRWNKGQNSWVYIAG